MAGAAELAIIIRAKDDASHIFDTLQGKAGGFGGVLGTALMAGAAAGGAAIMGLGAATIKVGADFDKAYDTIRIGTGATGEDLEDLKGVFKDVFKGVPTDMASASTAVADLNTRLGLTGEPLEAMSKQMLELSRLTKTDLSSNIQQVTRVFGDWGIAAENQSEALDKLFLTSQNTGIQVDRLGGMMVQYGAPMRQMGFSFDETAALMGKFEKEGVNTELVMGSLRIALGKMAREGEPVIETFQRQVEAIQNAGDTSEANALALELFGARAGPDMAAAIREGRFEIDDLVASLGDAGGTIIDTAKDTESFGEKFTLMKNKLLVAFEPLATQVFEGLGKLMDALTPHMERFSIWLGENLPRAIDWTKQKWQELQPHIENFQRFLSQDVIPIIQKVVEIFQRYWPRILAVVEPIFNELKLLIEQRLVMIKDIIEVIMAILQGDWGKAWEEIKDLVANQLRIIRELIINKLEAIKAIFTLALTIFKDLFGQKFMELKDKVLGIVGFLKDKLGEHWQEIVTVALAILFPPAGGLFALVTNSFGIRDKIQEAIGGLKDRLALIWESIRQAAVDKFWAILSEARNFGEKVLRWLWDGIQKSWEWFGEKLRGLEDKIKGILDPRNWWSTPAEHYYEMFKEVGPAIRAALEAGMPHIEQGVRPVQARLGLSPSPATQLIGPARSTTQSFSERRTTIYGGTFHIHTQARSTQDVWDELDRQLR